jgi:hypothetical protein
MASIQFIAPNLQPSRDVEFHTPKTRWQWIPSQNFVVTTAWIARSATNLLHLYSIRILIIDIVDFLMFNYLSYLNINLNIQNYILYFTFLVIKQTIIIYIYSKK